MRTIIKIIFKIALGVLVRLGIIVICLAIIIALIWALSNSDPSAFLS